MSTLNTAQEYAFTALGIKLTIMIGTVTSLSLYSKTENAFHTHAWHELFMPIEKTLILHFEDRNLILNPDNIIIIAPQTIHYAESNAVHPALSLSFSIEYLSKTDSARKLEAFFSFHSAMSLPADHTCTQLLHFLNSALMRQNSALCGSYLLSFLLHAAQLQQEQTTAVNSMEPADSKIGRIYQIESLLYRYYMDDLSLQEIATLLHMSTRQISRIINRQYGMGYRDKLHTLRMESAARMLLSGKTVSETAALIGYHSVSAFYNAFKRHYHTTPSEYRKKHPGNPNYS